jgi:hypothetical protein
MYCKDSLVDNAELRAVCWRHCGKGHTPYVPYTVPVAINKDMREIFLIFLIWFLKYFIPLLEPFLK